VPSPAEILVCINIRYSLVRIFLLEITEYIYLPSSSSLLTVMSWLCHDYVSQTHTHQIDILVNACFDLIIVYVWKKKLKGQFITLFLLHRCLSIETLSLSLSLSLSRSLSSTSSQLLLLQICNTDLLHLNINNNNNPSSMFSTLFLFSLMPFFLFPSILSNVLYLLLSLFFYSISQKKCLLSSY